MANEETLRDYLKWVSADLHQTQQRLKGIEAAAQEPIAITAMGCRFPGGVSGPEDLWRLLAEGRDAVSGFPADRGWDLDALYDPDPDQPGQSLPPSGGFLDDVAGFDAGVLRHLPARGRRHGPAAAAAAGERRGRRSSTPASTRRAARQPHRRVRRHQRPGLRRARLRRRTEDVEGYVGTGNAASVVSGRISYTLGLEGPAVTVDTACSSSPGRPAPGRAGLRQGECRWPSPAASP